MNRLRYYFIEGGIFALNVCIGLFAGVCISAVIFTVMK